METQHEQSAEAESSGCVWGAEARFGQSRGAQRGKAEEEPSGLTEASFRSLLMPGHRAGLHRVL